MEKQLNNNYAYTINVSPKKFFKGKQFGSYNASEQRRLYEFCIEIACNNIGQINYTQHDYRFELTKQGITHVHGRMRTSKEHIEMFQNKIHNLLGLPSLPKDICCKITKTFIHIDYWQHYMDKDQKPKQVTFPFVTITNQDTNDNTSEW